MYGRSVQSCMTPEKIKQWKENLSKGSKRNWQKEEYRNKVISANTGKKRTDEFRLGQSIRTKQSYVNNPELREQRGKLFSECWKDGRNHYHGKQSTNRSKEEIELFEALKALCKYDVTRETVRADNGKWYFPDILINGKVIVEFYGDYYHANPNIYDGKEVNAKKAALMEDIREYDAERQKNLEAMGYKFIVVWQSEWKADKQKVLQKVQDICDQSRCSLI